MAGTYVQISPTGIIERLITLRLLAMSPNKLCLITSNDPQSSSQLLRRGLLVTDEGDTLTTIITCTNIALISLSIFYLNFTQAKS